MDTTELGVAADENLATAWAALGRAMGADVIDDGPLTLVASGIPIAFFNGAYVRDTSGNPDSMIADAIEFFASRDLEWLLWVREGAAPNLLESGRAAGLHDVGGPPAMGVTPIPPSPPAPSGLTIEIATTIEQLADHAAMLREGFQIPAEVVDRLIRPALLDDPQLAVFVGRVAGEPVSGSLLAISGDTAGVYNVATPAEFRGRGYGAALTWAVVEEGARRGCTNAVLQASQLGYPVYRRMGFVDLGAYVQLHGPPLRS